MIAVMVTKTVAAMTLSITATIVDGVKWWMVSWVLSAAVLMLAKSRAAELEGLLCNCSWVVWPDAAVMMEMCGGINGDVC